MCLIQEISALWVGLEPITPFSEMLIKTKSYTSMKSLFVPKLCLNIAKTLENKRLMEAIIRIR